MSYQVLITGASSGIGKALAYRFAQDKHDLVLVARREQVLNDLAAELREIHGINVHVLAQDLAQAGAAAQLYSRLQSLGVHVDVLVNNAGFGTNGSFSEVELSGWQQMMQLNMVTLTELTYFVLPGMRERGFGRILNVSSVAGWMPCPNFAVYAATKAYVLSFSEALRFELRGQHIGVTTVCPGATATEFHEVAGNGGTMITRVMDTPELVAETAYKAMWKERGAVISGWMNKPLPFLLRLSPRGLVLRTAARVAKVSI